VFGLTGTSTPIGCQTTPFPIALTNYFKLTDSQVVTIQNAIAGNRDYLSRQSLKMAEIQMDIKDLTAGDPIDAAKLGSDYVALWQLQNEQSTQADQLMKTVRSVLNEQQTSLLRALENALAQYYLALTAVSYNILVLPPNLQTFSCGVAGTGNFADFLLGVPAACWFNANGYYFFDQTSAQPQSASPAHWTRLR
jgi:hypothetical protein